jgi:iron complex outermembrane receptor protein/outer membrane receptor for ferrienterochelin and colicins
MIHRLLFLFCLLAGYQASAQQPSQFRLRVNDSASGRPLESATIRVSGTCDTTLLTNNEGLALLTCPAGTCSLRITAVGHQPRQLLLQVPDTTAFTILLPETATPLDEVTVVSTTRTGDPVEYATTKVEILGQEEMQEESMIKPGNIASLLGDVSGVQIQQTSAITGNANVRILGLDGRYTQLLRDGMPLFDGFSGGFGVLSLAPLDLQQLELVKGPASALYGGGAIGGLVNFISRKPGYDPHLALIANQTSLAETNLQVYSAQRNRHVGYTLFAGQTWQRAQDVNADGFSDLPKTRSLQLHPTLFLYPTLKSSLSLSWSGSFDRRTGGDMTALDNRHNPAHPYYEDNQLRRHTFTGVYDHRLSARTTFALKALYSRFSRNLQTNTYVFNGRQENLYTEAAFTSRWLRHTLTGGLNVTGSYFRPSDATPIAAGNIRNTTAGLFVQDNWQLAKQTKLEAGLRTDRQFTYGNFILPRLALFHRFSPAWGLRLGYGLGYKVPDPLTPQLKEYDLPSIRPLPAGIQAEQSNGGTLEANYQYSWGEHNRIFINQAVFYTQIRHPLVGSEDAAGNLSFFNATKPVVTRGFDTYVQARLDELEMYIGYTWTDARRTYLDPQQPVPLAPRHRAAFTLLYELEGFGRAGAEASYNSSQYRDGDSRTPAYLFLAAMIEKTITRQLRVVLNCENLLDRRQSRYEALFTGPVTAPVFKPLWAPIDGRVFNLAIRWSPFGG